MIIVFGSVFQKTEELGEKYYCIYLAEGRNGKYWAKIQDLKMTEQLERMHSNPKYQYRLQLKEFDYTILKTEKFKGQAASYPYGLPEEYNSTTILIDDQDLKNLKDDIIKSPNVPIELKKEIQKLIK